MTRLLVKLCARLPFEEATEVYCELTRTAVSTTTAWLRTQAAGQIASPALHPIPTMKSTATDAECMGISMDGCMANVRSEGWKEIKIGAVFEVKPGKYGGTAEALDPAHGHAQSYVMHLGGPEGFGVKLSSEAGFRHWSRGDQSVVIGDGAVWIWNLAKIDYPSAAHVVDWWHAKQHLFAAAALIYPESPDAALQWANQQADLLYAGKALQIAENLYAAAGMAAAPLADKLKTEAGFFYSNHERMQYSDFRLAGLPIGSGTVESGAKQTKHRVSAAGMRWSRSGLQNLLPLRAALMSDTFDLFWQQLCPF